MNRYKNHAAQWIRESNSKKALYHVPIQKNRPQNQKSTSATGPNGYMEV